MTEVDFTYRGQLQGRNIRLLSIIPGPEMSTLEICLDERSLDGAEYEALSYVWGGQKKEKQVRCNGHWLSISHNLHDALVEKRRQRSTTCLWADATCINQDDNEEKSQQVRLMREIYAQANKVIIWMGKGRPGDDDAIRLARSLYDGRDGEQYDIDAGIYDFGLLDPQSLPRPLSDLSWNALFDILSHSWFSRVWVVQELLVAQKPVMWRGALKFDAVVMLWSAMEIGRHRNLYERFNWYMGSPPTSALMARSVAASYFDYKKKGARPIYDTLSRHAGMGATDPRDRVYALAGVSTGLDPGFVNYEKTFHDIACVVGKMTLLGFPHYQTEIGRTGMLSLAGDISQHRFPIEWLAFHANPCNHRLGIPSWIPDLFSAHSPGLIMSGFYNTVYLQGLRNIPKPLIRFRIEGQLHSARRFVREHGEIPLPDEIHIKGAIFDHVRTIIRNRPDLPSADSRMAPDGIDLLMAIESVAHHENAMISWLSELRLTADPTLNPNGSIMDGRSFEGFWRTLVYNRGPSFDYSNPNQAAADSLSFGFGYWCLLKKLQGSRRRQDDLGRWSSHCEILEYLAAPFEEAEARVRHARKFFVSQQGRIGWVPFRTEVGDRLCVFHGMRIPVVLRARGVKWEFVGACYVHGLMDGEVWDLEGLQWRFMSFV